MTRKNDKYLVYNSHNSFTKFNDIDEFKESSLDSMYKKLNDFKKNDKLKTVDPQTDKSWSQKVLDDAGDLFNELYYIFKEKYIEEKDGLNTKNKFFYYKKLRLTDNYQYESEEEEKRRKTTTD